MAIAAVVFWSSKRTDALAAACISMLHMFIVCGIVNIRESIIARAVIEIKSRPYRHECSNGKIVFFLSLSMNSELLVIFRWKIFTFRFCLQMGFFVSSSERIFISSIRSNMESSTISHTRFEQRTVCSCSGVALLPISAHAVEVCARVHPNVPICWRWQVNCLNYRLISVLFVVWLVNYWFACAKITDKYLQGQEWIRDCAVVHLWWYR